jgi:hypothetical protein
VDLDVDQLAHGQSLGRTHPNNGLLALSGVPVTWDCDCGKKGEFREFCSACGTSRPDIRREGEGAPKRPEWETCVVCGEEFDEDSDPCLESDDGKHETQAERDEWMRKWREARNKGYLDLEAKLNNLPD